MTDIKIRNGQGTWVIRAFGSVIGESSRVLILEEHGHADAVYFPREDIGMEFLEPSQNTSVCPKKGTASYFGISTTEGLQPDAAWSYEEPIAQAAEIKGYISFYTDKVTIEQL